HMLELPDVQRGKVVAVGELAHGGDCSSGSSGLVEDVVKIHLCLHGDIFQLPDVYGGGGGTGAAVGEGKGTGAPPGRGGAGEVGDASFGRDGADVCGARGFDRSVAVNGENILPV